MGDKDDGRDQDNQPLDSVNSMERNFNDWQRSLIESTDLVVTSDCIEARESTEFLFLEFEPIRC